MSFQRHNTFSWLSAYQNMFSMCDSWYWVVSAHVVVVVAVSVSTLSGRGHSITPHLPTQLHTVSDTHQVMMPYRKSVTDTRSWCPTGSQWQTPGHDALQESVTDTRLWCESVTPGHDALQEVSDRHQVMMPYRQSVTHQVMMPYRQSATDTRLWCLTSRTPGHDALQEVGETPGHDALQAVSDRHQAMPYSDSHHHDVMTDTRAWCPTGSDTRAWCPTGIRTDTMMPCPVPGHVQEVTDTHDGISDRHAWCLTGNTYRQSMTDDSDSHQVGLWCLTLTAHT